MRREEINLRIAVCDDEEAALTIVYGALEGVLAAYGKKSTIERFKDVDLLKMALNEQSYDLIFLDIEMPKMNGIELAKAIKERDNSARIVFVSNRQDLVFEALHIHPDGFIRKNHFIEDLTKLMPHLIQSLGKTEQQTIVIEDGQQLLRLNVMEITYIEGQGKKQLIHLSTADEPIEVRQSMKSFEERLNQYGFLRIHKGYLVNYHMIFEIGSEEVKLNDGEVLLISRRRLKEVQSAYLGLVHGEVNR